MDATPIVRRTTSEQVAHEIRRRIWSGEFRGGDRLQQEDLAGIFGVSRIPVREALIELSHEGTLQMSPHLGAFVEPLTETGVRDHYALYGHIDGFALRRAIDRADAQQRRELAEGMRRTEQQPDAAAMQRHVVAIRRHVHDLGGSPRFRAVARGLNGVVPGNFFSEIPGSIELAQRLLPAVGAGVASADASAAVASYAELMEGNGNLVLQVLRTKGLLQ